MELVWIVNAVLAGLVIFLLALLLQRGRSTLQQRRLEKELEELRSKLAEHPGAEPAQRLPEAELYNLVRDLETLRSAIAGAKICQREIMRRYKVRPGAEALERMLAKSKLPAQVKQKLADEFLVGEAGREILRLLDKGETIERISAEVGMPLIVTKSQITRLQLLGYLDGRLKPTEKGRRAMVA